MSAPATTTPIYDYPSHANVTRTTWFDQWTIAMAPEFNSRVTEAMKRRNMRLNIVELLHEAKNVRSISDSRFFRKKVFEFEKFTKFLGLYQRRHLFGITKRRSKI